MVWLFILFIAASGLSAWIGNDWGRRIGKRKLSVFALRPKHSSTFLTILLSMALSLGFLGLYLAIDSKGREALLHPETREEQQAQAYQEQVISLNQTLQRVQSRQSSRLALIPSQAPIGRASAGTTPLSQTFTHAAKPANRQPQRPHQMAQTHPSAQIPAVVPTLTPALPQTRPQTQAQAAVKQLLPAPIQTSQPHQPASPQPPESSLAMLSPRQAQPRTQLPETAAGTWQRQPEAASVPRLSLREAPLFELEVFGGRTPAESAQIIDGVLEMARLYAQEQGLSSAQLIETHSANLAHSRSQLENHQLYALDVKIGEVDPAAQTLPVRLSLRAQAADLSFDPHLLLEEARLQPESSGISLQNDLRLAILNLARDSRSGLALDATSVGQVPSPSLNASLPFSVVQLRRSGQTLQGQIVFWADAANLTEN